MDSAQVQARYKSGERNFKGALLSGVNLVWADLHGVDLCGADLSHANLSGANLGEVNLSGEANLAFADLSRADLHNANLKGTRLEGANLEGVQLEGAVYDEHTKFPKGFNPLAAGAIAGGRLAQEATESPSQQISEQPPKLVAEAQPAHEVPEASLPVETSFSIGADLEQYSLESPQLKAVASKSLAQSQSSIAPDVAPDVSLQTGQGDHSKPTDQNSQVVNPAAKIELFPQATKGASLGDVRAVKSDWQQAVARPSWPQTFKKGADLYLTNSSGQGKGAVIPVGVKGWNWGAFLLPWGWFVPNQVWGGILLWLLSLIPGWTFSVSLIFAFAFGCKGNEWAWRSRPWNSVDDFRRHQRYWAITGFIMLGLLISTTLFFRP
jgi:uncharacterized protein YjbI with pentapeptide repeats